jgi:hypothetical protein
VTAAVERLAWSDLPLGEIALPKAELALTLGLGSGLTRRETDPPGRVFAVTDRGPNLFVGDAIDRYGVVGLERLRGERGAKIMPVSDAGPEIAELSVEGGGVRLLRRFPLMTRTGRRISGRPLPGGGMEKTYDLEGRLLEPDVLGADTEAIAAMPDGSFLVADEYGPSLMKVDADGVVTERWVAETCEENLEHPDIVVRKVLPAETGLRRPNRGLEGLAASDDGASLYLAMQSSLADEREQFAPIWKLSASDGRLRGFWRYPFDDPESFRRDAARRKVGWSDLKLCELARAGRDRFIALERIAHTTKLYEIDLARLPAKRLLASSDEFPDIGPDIEGVALLSPTELLLASDNDFGIEGAATAFWRIRFDAPV